MSEAKASVNVEMSKTQRLWFLMAVYMLFAGFAASGFGSSVLLPAQLAAMDGMGFYALATALSTLGMILMLPLVGTLYARFGSKRVAIFGVFLQLIVRFGLMVFNTNIFVYLTLYCLQNMGCGLYISAPYSLITDVTEPAERPKFFGYLVATRAFGSLVGPLLTGRLMDLGYANLGWLSYLPFMIISVPIIMALYPNIKKQGGTGKFDFAGVFLMVIGLCGIVMWLSLGGKFFDWISVSSIALLAVGVASMALLIRRESKHPNPAVPVNVFKYKKFTTVFVCLMLITAYGTCSAGYLIAYAQQVMQVSSTVSSTVIMPQTIIETVLGAFIGGYIGKNFAKRFRPMTLLSLLLVTVATFMLYILKPSSSMIVIYAATLIGGFSQIAPQAVFPSFFQMDVKPEDNNAAISMFKFATTGGACLFSAFAGVILNAGFGFNSVFLLGTAFCATALIIGFFGFRLPKEAATEA